MIRFWRKRHLFRLPVPPTGAAALWSGQNWELDEWLPAFLRAIEREAADGLDLLYAIERAWFEARHSIASGARFRMPRGPSTCWRLRPCSPRQRWPAFSGSR